MRPLLNAALPGLMGLAVLAGLVQPVHAGCTPGAGSDPGQNTCVGADALSANTSGTFNTAVGSGALQFNTEGSENTAIGLQALRSNSTGSNNTASGRQALASNFTGRNNTAAGSNALAANHSGSDNTAVGRSALGRSATANNNTAVGALALAFGQTGSNNTALGVWAGGYQMGSDNISIGFQSASRQDSPLKTGNNNIAIGTNAGSDWTTGSNNIAIASNGDAADLNTIRIGTPGTQARTFIAGIRGASVRGASIVLIDAAGQLATVRSALRYKEDVQPMGDASSPLMNLRPVTFRYREADPDGTKPIQYGLIAEEVEKVMPDLVVRNEDGAIETVAYHILPGMLLNEYQKQNRELAETKAKLAAVEADHQARIDAMAAELAALRLAVSRLAALPDGAPQPAGSALLAIRQATE